MGVSMPEPDSAPTRGDLFQLVHHPVPAGMELLVVQIAGYRETRREPIRMVETASLVVPLVIGFDAPFEIALGRAPLPDERYTSFTSGLFAGPVMIRSHGGAQCIQVNFTPLGAHRFFGMPMHKLTGQMVPIDALGDRDLGELRERLGEEPLWPARFALLERFLGRRFAAVSAAGTPAGRAYQAILASGGRIPVSRLAGRLEWSRKHLAARFHEEIGLPPKQVARIARFDAACRLATAGGAQGWADVAAACGYADQAHLVREFRAFTGVTPAAWLAA